MKDTYGSMHVKARAETKRNYSYLEGSGSARSNSYDIGRDLSSKLPSSVDHAVSTVADVHKRKYK